MPKLTPAEIKQVRVDVLKSLRQEPAVCKRADKKCPPIVLDVKKSSQPAVSNIDLSQKLKAKVKSVQKNNISGDSRVQSARHRPARHLEKNNSPLHQPHFLGGLKLLIIVLGILIIFLTGFLIANPTILST